MTILANKVVNITKGAERMGTSSESAADEMDMLRTHAEGAGDSLKKAKKSVERTTIEIEKMASIRSGLQAAVLKQQTILPHAGEGPAPIATSSTGAVGVERMAGVIGDLASSLDKLQTNIVSSLEKGMSRGMEIIKSKAGESFRLAEGGREFEIRIADIRGIKEELRKIGELVEPGIRS